MTDLYQRLVDNISGTTTEETFRIYAGSRELAQVVRENGVDKTLFFHADNLGTPETITTSDHEVIHQELDAWGSESGAPPTELTRVGFTGHEHDRDLGLIDMKGRVYDPLASRFTSADPITQAPFWSQGLNRYTYVFNDPVNSVDPSGFFSISPGYPAGAVFGWGSGLATLGGVGINVATTLLTPSTPGGTFSSSGAGGQSVPTSVHSRAGIDAASNNDGRVGPAVQEAGDLKGFPATDGPSMQSEKLASKGNSRTRPRGAPTGARNSPVLRPSSSRPQPLPPRPPAERLIERSENVKGGHLMRKHIGRTPAELAHRLRTEKISAASTFRNLEEAGRAVSEVTRTPANQHKIRMWLATGAQDPLAVHGPFSGGQVLQRGASAPVQGNRAGFVLVPDGGGGFTIFTGMVFP